MTLHRKLNIALFVFVVCAAYVLMLGFGHYADNEDDEALSSQAYVAKRVCGENAGYKFDGEELTCPTKKGHKASKQTVASK